MIPTPVISCLPVSSVTATVTDPETAISLSALTADQTPSDSQIHLFLEMVLAWPGENSSGWIKLHTNRPAPRGQSAMSGWTYRNPDAFVNQARESHAGNSPKHDADGVRGVPAEHDGRSEPSSRMAGAEHAELAPMVTTTADVPSAFAAQADADQHFAEITATAFPAAKGAYL
jgi:hypothetical protein